MKESSSSYDARSPPPAPGALQALLLSRLSGLATAAAAAAATPEAATEPPHPAHDTTVASAFSLLHQHTHERYPRISTHHVDLTALSATATSTAAGAAATATAAAAVPGAGPEPAVLFSDLVEEAALEEQYGNDVADNMRLVLDMVRPPDSQLWTLILAELQARLR